MQHEYTTLGAVVSHRKRPSGANHTGTTGADLLVHSLHPFNHSLQQLSDQIQTFSNNLLRIPIDTIQHSDEWQLSQLPFLPDLASYEARHLAIQFGHAFIVTDAATATAHEASNPIHGSRQLAQHLTSIRIVQRDNIAHRLLII